MKNLNDRAGAGAGAATVAAGTTAVAMAPAVGEQTAFPVRHALPTSVAGMAVPPDLVAELRTDHAGETGAVWIYRGILAFSREPGVRAFAERHLETELAHLSLVSQLLPRRERSWLIGPWCVAGFLTGAIPALFGPTAVYGTIAAVETFVDRHYDEQIRALDGRPEYAALQSLLLQCQADECHHRDEAGALAGPQARGGLLRAWCGLVGWGSATAVKIARVV